MLALGGCANEPRAISLGLSQMGTEEAVDAGSWLGGLQHRRSYNITGLGAVDTLGMVSLNPDPPLFPWPGFSRARLPDNLALRLSPECSMVVSVNYSKDSPGTSIQSEVLTARQALVALQDTQVQLLSLSVRQTLFQVLAQSAIAKENAELANTADKAQKVQEYSKLVAAMRLLPDGAELLADAETPAAREKATTVAKANMEMATRKNLDAQAAVERAVNTPGIVISRWAMAKEKVSTFEAADAASVKNAGSDQQDGFLILGNPRVDTLVVGDDFLWRACKAETANCKQIVSGEKIDSQIKVSRTGIDSITKPARQFITTYQLLAQSWGWTEDRSLQRIKQLSLNVGSLIAALEPLVAHIASVGDTMAGLKQLKVQVESTHSLAMSATNAGYMAPNPSSIDIRPFSFATDADHNESVRRELRMQNGYGRLISMRTTLDSYATKRGDKVVFPQQDVNYCGNKLQAYAASYADLEKNCEKRPTEEQKKQCKKDLQEVQTSLQDWLGQGPLTK
ncbi:MAG: hypothetical protein QE265_03845 [Rhodoferax sp.]|nr:hypothetical protein [Rhodoferax sp.]